MPTYICTVRWKALGDKKKWEKTGKSGNILFDAYLSSKRKWKEKKEKYESSRPFVAHEEF